MNTRERIERMIEGAKQEQVNSLNPGYWNGYIGALEELKLSVKPKEGA